MCPFSHCNLTGRVIYYRIVSPIDRTDDPSTSWIEVILETGAIDPILGLKPSRRCDAMTDHETPGFKVVDKRRATTEGAAAETEVDPGASAFQTPGTDPAETQAAPQTEAPT